MPRLITSTPAARLSAILRSSCANAYGGMRSRRLLGFMKLLLELVAETTLEHRARPACQIDLQALPHLDDQLAAVQDHGHELRGHWPPGGRPRAHVGDGGAGGARA